MTVALGLLAAALYGIADFAGGVASRRHNALTVLLFAYPIGALLMVCLLPLFPGTVNARVIVYGTLGGVAGLLGVILLYSLMTVAPINVISPVTAVLSAIVPVVVGVAIGERPRALAWGGVAIGLLAVILTSRTTEEHPHGRIGIRILLLAVLAGLGFGLYFVFLARAGNGSGLWPLGISRIASAVLIIPLAFGRRAVTPIRGAMIGVVIVAAVGDALANMAFLLASRHGLLSLASVLTSLYPAMTVLLAMTLLKEHATLTQRVGLGLAAAAVVLITV